MSDTSVPTTTATMMMRDDDAADATTTTTAAAPRGAFRVTHTTATARARAAAVAAAAAAATATASDDGGGNNSNTDYSDNNNSNSSSHEQGAHHVDPAAQQQPQPSPSSQSSCREGTPPLAPRTAAVPLITPRYQRKARVRREMTVTDSFPLAMTPTQALQQQSTERLTIRSGGVAYEQTVHFHTYDVYRHGRHRVHSRSVGYSSDGDLVMTREDYSESSDVDNTFTRRQTVICNATVLDPTARCPVHAASTSTATRAATAATATTTPQQQQHGGTHDTASAAAASGAVRGRGKKYPGIHAPRNKKLRNRLLNDYFASELGQQLLTLSREQRAAAAAATGAGNSSNNRRSGGVFVDGEATSLPSRPFFAPLPPSLRRTFDVDCSRHPATWAGAAASLAPTTASSWHVRSRRAHDVAADASGSRQDKSTSISGSGNSGVATVRDPDSGEGRWQSLNARLRGELQHAVNSSDYLTRQIDDLEVVFRDFVMAHNDADKNNNNNENNKKKSSSSSSKDNKSVKSSIRRHNNNNDDDDDSTSNSDDDGSAHDTRDNSRTASSTASESLVFRFRDGYGRLLCHAVAAYYQLLSVSRVTSDGQGKLTYVSVPRARTRGGVRVVALPHVPLLCLLRHHGRHRAVAIAIKSPQTTATATAAAAMTGDAVGADALLAPPQQQQQQQMPTQQTATQPRDMDSFVADRLSSPLLLPCDMRASTSQELLCDDDDPMSPLDLNAPALDVAAATTTAAVKTATAAGAHAAKNSDDKNDESSSGSTTSSSSDDSDTIDVYSSCNNATTTTTAAHAHVHVNTTVCSTVHGVLLDEAAVPVYEPQLHLLHRHVAREHACALACSAHDDDDKDDGSNGCCVVAAS